MSFRLPDYNEPDFTVEPLKSGPDAITRPVEKDGVAPDGFHATTIFPEYIKVNNTWKLISNSRMDCVVVVKEKYDLEVKEFRRLIKGEQVVVGRSEDGREGIFVHSGGFRSQDKADDSFAFRTGRSRETSFSRDYDRLYELLRHEKENGFVVWVLGPAVVFDYDSRNAMVSLINNGYVDAVFAGNALATHDIEGTVFKTALGQDIYNQSAIAKGHYHHIEVINRARRYHSLEEYITAKGIHEGVMHACIKKSVPLVLAGSIRDDGPLPGVITDVLEAQNAMREYTKKATTVLGLATQLHTIAAGNMTPAYQVANGTVRPVFIYSIDVSEFVANKLRDRRTLEVTSIITNVQDFLVHLSKNLQ
jgi:lysine-ketoglutarate reductase/saccharopine dehydrogenase-like protein (TIGR00300 family)